MKTVIGIIAGTVLAIAVLGFGFFAFVVWAQMLFISKF